MFVCNLFGASCQAYYAGLPEREGKNYLLFVSWLFLLAGYTMKLHPYYLISTYKPRFYSLGYTMKLHSLHLLYVEEGGYFYLAVWCVAFPYICMQ